MADVYSPPRRRHGRSATAIVDVRSIQRSDSYPVYNVRPGYHAQTPRLDQPQETSQASSSTPRISASRIMESMWRSFSTPRKRDVSPMDKGMFSTPVESSPPLPPRYNMQDGPRPTIQQIAMGLHVSRTPHLHPSRSPVPPHARSRHRDSSDVTPDTQRSAMKPAPLGVDSHRRRGSASAMMLPPPPPKRSSLKKPGTPTTPHSAPAPAPFTPSASLTPSTSDLSLTGSTLTSAVPPPPRTSRSASVALFPARLQMSMSKLLRVPSSRKTSTSPVASTPSTPDSASAELTPRKTVRFSNSQITNDQEAVS